MTVPVSVCVLACNEEAELPRCFDSVSFADQLVVVVDEKSTDGSEKIARERADVVERRVYAGDVDQKQYCTSLARNDWVLIVDPDEVVSPELAAEIQRVLEGAVESSPSNSASPAEGPAGYRVNRLTYHLGRWIRHGDFYPDRKLRLFRRSKATWVGSDPHGRVDVADGVGDLSGDLWHYSYRDLADQIERVQFFSGQAASAMIAEGRRFRLSDLVLRPPARFLRAYVLNRGFLDGLPGFVIAVASAFYVFLKYAKLWEKHRALGAEISSH